MASDGSRDKTGGRRITPEPAPADEEARIEDLIDESIEESFPASDPPAVSPERDPVRIPPAPKRKAPPKKP